MPLKWVRAKDGAIFGVCKGIARSLDLSVGLVRLLWLLSVIFLGTGLLVYLALAITLPREDKTVEAMEPKILGVCAKIALRSQLEVGIVRFLALCLAVMSLGASVVGYIVLYFVLDQPTYKSDNRPETPRATV